MTVEQYLTYVIMPLLSLAILVILIRFFKGSQIVDRVIALDLIITAGVGFIGIFCMITNNNNFLDVAMILALIAFLSTVAFSYYLYRSKKND